MVPKKRSAPRKEEKVATIQDRPRLAIVKRGSAKIEPLEQIPSDDDWMPGGKIDVGYALVRPIVQATGEDERAKLQDRLVKSALATKKLSFVSGHSVKDAHGHGKWLLPSEKIEKYDEILKISM
jgi:hypothetical protein